MRILKSLYVVCLLMIHTVLKYNQLQLYFLKLQLQKTEEINVDLAPGTYAVSTGAWGSDRQHTHVVHVKDGQTVDLNFGL